MRVKEFEDVVVDGTTPSVIHRRERRNASLLSKRIYEVVKEVIAPVAHRTPDTGDHHELFTSFTFTEQENITIVLKDVLIRDCPSIMNDRQLFLRIVEEAFDAAALDKIPKD